MANIIPQEVINSLRGHIRGDRDITGGNNNTQDPPVQDIFGGESRTDEPSEKPAQKEEGVKESVKESVEEGKEDFGDAPDEPFTPALIDIYVVRAMLAQAKNLPTDVVDIIFDHAEYWAHSSNEIDYTVEHGSALRVSGRSATENKFILRSYPVGLIGPHHKKDLSEELAWDTTEAKPQPLGKEQEAEYFKKLADYPTPKLVYPARKIVFSIRSRDQGHGGEAGTKGTFNSSWTWFEAGLEKFDADQSCDPQCTYDVRHKSQTSKASPLPVCGLRPLYPEIQPDQAHEGKFKYDHPLHRNRKHEIFRNRTATRAINDREVTWRWTDKIHPDSSEAQKIDEQEGRGRETMDGEFVRNLKMGDVVTVWAKAMFPAWVNYIEKVKIDIYWAV